MIIFQNVGFKDFNEYFKMDIYLYFFLIMNIGTLLFDLDDNLKRSFRSYKNFSEKLVKVKCSHEFNRLGIYI